jgi:hypothetical protein
LGEEAGFANGKECRLLAYGLVETPWAEAGSDPNVSGLPPLDGCER